MDPQAVLQRAWDAMLLGEEDECRDALGDYYGWRAIGGFQPDGGDALAAGIEKALEERFDAPMAEA